MTAQITPLRTRAEAEIIEQFKGLKSVLPGVADLRDEGFETFARLGLPTRRVESWHYTDLRVLMSEAPPQAPEPDAETIAAARDRLALLPGPAAARLLLLDGLFMADASDLGDVPAGLTISSMARALTEGRADVVSRLGGVEVAKGDVALALNTAFMRDGVVIEVAAETSVAAPLHVLTIRAGRAANASSARSLVLVGRGASLTIVEHFESFGGGASHTMDAIEFRLAEGARVDHIVLQKLNPAALLVSTLTAHLEAGAEFKSFALTTGAAVVRRQVFVRGDAPDVTIGLAGVSLLNRRQHADTTIVVDHASTGGESRERFRHIVDEEATGIFQGKVIVRPGAQKTDGGMKSNAVLLSETATMNHKPELEIFADDVVCGHGATCGALDDDHLFYLMARGLPRPQAEALLLEAFAGEILEQVGDEAIRDLLMLDVRAWLARRDVRLSDRMRS